MLFLCAPLPLIRNRFLIRILQRVGEVRHGGTEPTIFNHAPISQVAGFHATIAAFHPPLRLTRSYSILQRGIMLWMIMALEIVLEIDMLMM